MLVEFIFVCLALTACNETIEEKALAKKINGNDAEGTNEMHRKLPECAQRNKDGTYKIAGGCTAEQWVEWQKSQDAMIAPSR